MYSINLQKDCCSRKGVLFQIRRFAMAFVRMGNIKIVRDILKKNEILLKKTALPYSVASLIDDTKAFEIPTRIPRSKTDILKALDSCVKMDKGAADFRFHDDPYLTPLSNTQKQSYALSKESGRNAAKYVLDSNPKLFKYKPADPQIDVFQPIVNLSKTEVSEELLQHMINSDLVDEAIAVFKGLQQKGIAVGKELEESLLQLYCFRNGKNVLDLDYNREELYFSDLYSLRKDKTNVWRHDTLVDDIVNNLEKNPVAVNTLIRGYARHFNSEDAWQLYQSAVAENAPIDVQTFNAIINIAGVVKQGYEPTWDLILEILTTMSAKGVQPDLCTLNNCLQQLSNMNGFKPRQKFAFQLVEEMKSVGVNPSLASYHFLLHMCCKQMYKKNDLLYSILTNIEKEFEESSIPARDPRDCFFFSTAMEVCGRHLKDINAAHRLNKLLENGNNNLFLSRSFFQKSFYRIYLELALNSYELDDFMLLYGSLVPNRFSLEKNLLHNILKAVLATSNYKYVLDIWMDIYSISLYKNEEIMDEMLLAISHYNPEEDSDDVAVATKTQSQLGSVCRHVIDVILEDSEIVVTGRQQYEWTSRQAGLLVESLTRLNATDAAGKLLKCMFDKPNSVTGEIEVETCQMLFEKACELGDTNTALYSVLYARRYTSSEETLPMAEKLFNFDLDDAQTERLGFAFPSLVKNDA